MGSAEESKETVFSVAFLARFSVDASSFRSVYVYIRMANFAALFSPLKVLLQHRKRAGVHKKLRL